MLADRRENVASEVLLGREPEKKAITDLLTAIKHGFGASLVLRGEAGIGKTALLDYAIGSAEDVLVVRVVGIESEMKLGFAALQQLVQPFVRMIDHLPGPQQQALATAIGLVNESAPDQFLVGLATLTLLSAGAAEKGLLCVIDDAQWLDQTSAEVLTFVARRLEADRVAFLFAVREPGESSVSLEGLVSLPLMGLDRDASLRLLARVVLGVLDSGVGEHIAARAGGNPLALLELTRELSEDQRAGFALLPDPLPVAEEIQERFWRRIVKLTEQAQELLLLAAAEPSGDSRLFWRAADVLRLDQTTAHWNEVGDLLDVSERVTFRHPLIRSVAYRGATDAARRRVHAAIAAASDQEIDSDRIAWHLAAAAVMPDDEIAEALEQAAQRARSRGDTAGAAAYLRRSAELTPIDSRRAHRLLAAAEAEFTIGATRRALALLEHAAPDLPDPASKAGAIQLRGAAQFVLGDGRASSSLLHASQMLMPIDERTARDTLLDAMISGFYSGGRQRTEALKVSRSIGPARGPDPSIQDLLTEGMTELHTSGPEIGVPILCRAVKALLAEDLPEHEGLRWYGYGMWAAVESLDYDSWALMASRWVALCRAKGALMNLPLALDYLGTWQAFTGKLDAADATNTEGREILAATGNPAQNGTTAVEIISPAWRGQEERVRARAAEFIRGAVEREQHGSVGYGHYVLGILEISLCNYSAALDRFRILLDDNGPYFGAIVLPDAVEAAEHSGDRETATVALERLEKRALASKSELSLGLLARCRAIVAVDEEKEALYLGAIAHLGRCRSTSELARTHLLFGEWLRRQRRRRDARVHLHVAYESFEAFGALRFAERAAQELAATGTQARTRTVERTDQLTVRESQIARLVVTGATNAEVAAQLFISSSTVDYHLRHIFSKLGLRSRTALVTVFRDET